MLGKHKRKYARENHEQTKLNVLESPESTKKKLGEMSKFTENQHLDYFSRNFKP